MTFTVGGAGVSDGYLAKMSQTIDSDTWTVEFDDHLSSVTDASGGTTSFEWTGDDITRITPPAGKTTTVGYDASNRVTQVVRDHWTGGYTATTELAYSSANNRLEVTVTDPNDHETIYRGDAFGKIDDVTDVLGHKRSTTYSPNNDVATAVDAQSAANTTTYSYSDAAGGYTPTGTTAPPRRIHHGQLRLHTYNPPAGQATCTGGGKPGQACTQTDGRGNVTTFIYDAAGNLVKVTPRPR